MNESAMCIFYRIKTPTHVPRHLGPNAPEMKMDNLESVMLHQPTVLTLKEV